MCLRVQCHGDPVLRRLMWNGLGQQVCQATQRSAEGVVDPLGAGVGRDLGGQTRQQPLKGLRPVALQREEVLQLADHHLYDLALARGPAAVLIRPRPQGVVLRGGRDERPVLLQPVPLPLNPRKPFVRQRYAP
jgi:hypothetical protein